MNELLPEDVNTEVDINALLSMNLPKKYQKMFRYYESALGLTTNNERIMLIGLFLPEINKRAFLCGIDKIKEVSNGNFVAVEVTYSTGMIHYWFYTGKKTNRGLFGDPSNVLP